MSSKEKLINDIGELLVVFSPLCWFLSLLIGIYLKEKDLVYIPVYTTIFIFITGIWLQLVARYFKYKREREDNEGY